MTTLNADERAALGWLLEGIDPADVALRCEEGDAASGLVLLCSRGRPIALGHRIFIPPGRRGDVALLAHELMHVRQYREWGPLVYYARGAWEQARYLAFQMGLAANPYDWRSEAAKPFTEYGMEQQAQLVEDAVRGDQKAMEIVRSEK
ncbi:MAG TPA: DUF4157 domain-containing protein [Gemmatimonadales bacterium]|nr:DUF4157 domain-containing protein [Gemmatimonadales bacterium]